MKKRLIVGLALLIAGAAAAQVVPWRQVELSIAPATLTSMEQGATDLGALTYAGGFYLTAANTTQLGGVSGLEAEPIVGDSAKFYAVTDNGGFIDFTADFDRDGHLSGARNLSIAPLRGPDGEPLQGKMAGDAEDLSLIPGLPGYLISFERDHRIVAYEDPRRADAAQVFTNIPAEARRAPKNGGIEAMAALPGDRMAVGLEDGRLWVCSKGSNPCTALDRDGRPGLFYTLSAMDALGDTGDLIAAYRRPNPLGFFDLRIVHIGIQDGHAQYRELATLAREMPNIEGLTVIPSPDNQGWRIFVISDNGFRSDVPTLFAAFDWRR